MAIVAVPALLVARRAAATTTTRATPTTLPTHDRADRPADDHRGHRRGRHRGDGGDRRDRGTSSGTGETVTIVASVPPTDHGWLGQIAAKAQEAADQYDDVEFRLLEAADADSQASQIETVINEKPDALVVLPYDGAQLTPVAEKAMEAGIPVDQRRPALRHAGGGAGDDPRRQLPDRCQGGDVHRRPAELRGQRRRDPGHRRHLGDQRPHPGLRRHDRGAVRGRHQDRRPAAGRLRARPRASR